jgi:signal transduction histidine kinase
VTESPTATSVNPLPDGFRTLSASPEGVAVASWILVGDGSVTESVERVGEFLASHADVDLVAVSLTQIVPDRGDDWVHLGERAWLREWRRPGTTCSVAPQQDAGAEQALSMPWVSQQVRRARVAVIPDARLLPPAADQDRREMAVCGVSALVTAGVSSSGVMFGSLAMGRETAGEWPEPLVADLALFSSALGSRMSEAKARESLADAIQRGDLARASQQEFFSAIGHELRTPIAAVVGTAEMLGEDARDLLGRLPENAQPHDGVLTEHAARFAVGVARDADVVLSAGEQLLAIVDDLLGTGQKLGGGAESQWVDVADAVADVVHWLRAPAISARVRVTADIDPQTFVLTTPSGVRQILTNLVGNAIAYNVPDGTVRVTQSRSHNEFGEPRVRVSVRDTGPGLTTEQQREVFKPFVRFAGPEVRGTGLGLSLSRSLAERDGGMMGVESTPGDGSVFWVDLPAAAPEAR